MPLLNLTIIYPLKEMTCLLTWWKSQVIIIYVFFENEDVTYWVSRIKKYVLIGGYKSEMFFLRYHRKHEEKRQKDTTSENIFQT